MILCIAHTTNIGILFDSKDPYKYFDIKNLGFYSQKAANHPPHPQNKKNTSNMHQWTCSLEAYKQTECQNQLNVEFRRCLVNIYPNIRYLVELKIPVTNLASSFLEWIRAFSVSS